MFFQHIFVFVVFLCFKTGQDECFMMYNTDYPGMDLNLDTGRTSDRQDSAVACRNLCNQNKDCKYFGWKAFDGHCWLKTGISRDVTETGTISGRACTTGHAPDPTDECTMEEDTDYPGMDLNLDTGRTSDRQVSALACRNLCNQNKDCKYFGWKPYDGQCWLKTGISRRVKETGTISGKACTTGHAPDPCEISDECNIDEDTDYPGMDLNLDTGRTLDRQDSAQACRNLCNQNMDCKYFGWKASDGQCWLKKGISMKVPESGTISGKACRKGCSLQPTVVTNRSLALFTKNIFAIWWDPAHDHKAEAKRMADTLISVRDDCLNNFGMKDPSNPGSGFYYNVFIWREGDLFPSWWGNGQGTDQFGYPFATIHYLSVRGPSVLYHEGFHMFQYEGNSPGFAYTGDSNWYIEATANWYKAQREMENWHVFNTAGAILANPHLAMWHYHGNQRPDDPVHWMYGIKRYAMNTFLTYLTEEAGVEKKIVTDGFYANTALYPQEYLYRRIGANNMRKIFADWAAHNTGGMDYITKDQLQRAYLEITHVKGWDYYHPFVWSSVNKGTEGDWFSPPTNMSARGWAYNVFNINNTETATYHFELEGDATGSQEAASFFLGRLVVMFNNNPVYSEMTMTSALSGTATVSVNPENSSLFLIVVSVPEFFSGNQHYGYQVKITKQ